MKLVATLMAGFKGAENGTAELYNRGTSTRATWYSSFEGGTATSTGADISLDSNGRAEVYVDQLTDIVVKSSAGTTLGSFTEGEASSSVEVRSSAFTGTHYDTAASAVSNPTTAKAIFDLWKTNAGNTSAAIDWKVLFNAASTSIYSALGIITGYPFYNVKDPAYGAVGDGATDDTSAIQAAITAAGAATYGGVVLFPPGNYKITAALTTSSGLVSFIGSGSATTKLVMAHASNDMLQLTNAASGRVQFQRIEGIHFYASQSNSGYILKFVDSGSYLVQDCEFGFAENAGTNYNDGELIYGTNADTIATFNDCTFFPNTDEAVWFTGYELKLNRCTFEPTKTAYTPPNQGAVIYGTNIYCYGCTFEAGYVTGAGVFTWYKSSSTTVVGGVYDCIFSSVNGPTVTGMTLGTYVAASAFVESGNVFEGTTVTAITAYSYTVAAANTGATVQLRSRENRWRYYSSNAGTLTLAADQYGKIVVVRSGDAACAYTISNAPEGSKLEFLLVGGGIAGAQTLPANVLGDGSSSMSSLTFTNTYSQGLSFISTAVGATHYWALMQFEAARVAGGNAP